MTISQQKLNPELAQGLMFGVAIGDALGGPLEFMDACEISEKHGEVREMLGGGWLNLKKGQITDDTQMTLAVADGIIQNPKNPVPSVGKMLKNWLKTRPVDVGITCKSVIKTAIQHNFDEKEEWFKLSQEYDVKTKGESAGNGSLMRMSYPAIFYPTDIAVDNAVDLGKMTHWHEHSTTSITCYTKAVSKLVRMDKTVDIATRKELLESYMKEVRQINSLQCDGETPPSGYVIHSLICALNCIQNTENFEDAVVKAVNLGGDADTIGAITGSLAGVIYGMSAIPERWISALDKDIKTRLNELVNFAIEKQA